MRRDLSYVDRHPRRKRTLAQSQAAVLKRIADRAGEARALAPFLKAVTSDAVPRQMRKRWP